MKRISMYCDHCGQELDKYDSYDEILISIASEDFEADLCKKCFDKLNDVVKAFLKGGEG